MRLAVIPRERKLKNVHAVSMTDGTKGNSWSYTHIIPIAGAVLAAQVQSQAALHGVQGPKPAHLKK